MAKKKRCAVHDCSRAVSAEYHFCYHHRKWSHADVKKERKDFEESCKQISMKRFFCDPCGTVDLVPSDMNCRMCGHKMEELN